MKVFLAVTDHILSALSCCFPIAILGCTNYPYIRALCSETDVAGLGAQDDELEGFRRSGYHYE